MGEQNFTDSVTEIVAKPRSRMQYFMAKVAGIGMVDTVKPKTKNEYMLDKIAESGGERLLPVVTTSDNDKFLRVVSGVWTAVIVPSAESEAF